MELGSQLLFFEGKLLTLDMISRKLRSPLSLTQSHCLVLS